jgi:cytochrome c553
VDFPAPTCAVCHNAALADPDGGVAVPRTHDFGARLWVRLFGAPYAHPQPKNGNTTLIRNADAQPLPVTFGGQPASAFLIDAEEQTRRRAAMAGICRTCHSSSWAEGHFQRLDAQVTETDRMVRAATQLLERGWERGLANRANPFDEPLEQKWLRQWLFYAGSVRYSAAMGGADYASFKNGWWDLTRNLKEMEEALRAGAR